MNTTTPYAWLTEVPTALLQMDDIPLLGFPPDFPWEEFSEKLKAILQAKSLEVKPLELKWRNKDDLFSGLGQDLIPLHFQIPSLEGDLCALLAKRDILLMMSSLLAGQKEPLDIIDPEFQNGFIHFLAYEAIYIFNQCNFDKSLNPHLAEKQEDQDEDLKAMLLQRDNTLTQDISFQLNDLSFIFRLVISNEFRKSWKEKYAARTLDIPLHSSLAKKIHVPVAIEVGRTQIPLSEWKKVAIGDFLLLDSCGMDPANDKAKVMLTVNGNHFFRARLKDGSIKLLEHPLFFEGQLNEKVGDLDKLENEARKNMARQDDDHDVSDEEQSEMDEDFTFDDEEEDHKEEQHEETTDTQKEVAESSKSEVKSSLPKFIADEMMLDIIVEVGRLEMSIQKLTELVPGNILEIDVRPESGVDLVVNGKRIGKGELLKIGEVLGVRILDI